MKLPALKLSAIATCFAFGFSQANATAVIAATEPTQILNNIQLVMSYVEHVEQTLHQAEMIVHQLEQYQTMIRNLQQLPATFMQDLTNTLSSLTSVVSSASGLSYAVSSIDARFDATHKGYSDYVSANLTPGGFHSLYQKWQSLHRETSVTALKELNLQESDFSNEDSTIASIKAQVATSDGAVQAITVGSEVALQNVSQLQLLRKLIMNQTQMQARYASIQEERDQAAAAASHNKTQGTDAPVGDESTY